MSNHGKNLENPVNRSPLRDSDLASLHDEIRARFFKPSKIAPTSSHSTEKASTSKISIDGGSQGNSGGVSFREIVGGYRKWGYTHASLDPLGLSENSVHSELRDILSSTESEKNSSSFSYGHSLLGATSGSIKDLRTSLESVYCRSIGFDIDVVDAKEKDWFYNKIENELPETKIGLQGKLQILDRLTAAEGLEKYLQRRYPGTKRFGLEGGETLIPVLHEILLHLGENGCLETVIGMAHRGRLNVLVNILGKKPQELIEEFEGKVISDSGSGDVKYHQGFSSNLIASGGQMHLALGFNPSHLEIGCPVIQGSVRARQDRRRDYSRDLVVPILIHGDAAFAGQGVVMETFQMSQTRGFTTGGAIHLVINNQIGFTTHDPRDSRSTLFATDVAKFVGTPILHVNGDDPIAAVYAGLLAAEYRQKFNKDIVLDIIGYRRRGHNEAEDPSKTQPQMYQEIRKHPTTRDLFLGELIRDSLYSKEDAQQDEEGYRKQLEGEASVISILAKEPDESLFVDWKPYLNRDWNEQADTTFPADKLKRLMHTVCTKPKDFSLHKQVEKIMSDRLKMADGSMPINWGFGEIAAYASLLDEGRSIRLTGQDCGVGTFSHRHACIHNQDAKKRSVTLSSICHKGNTFDIYDSLLSEEAVLAFEYGYASTAPDTLVIWEAQFGDFANGAQVVIDQFISSGEEKWGRLCGLVMFLPHGFEGAGPEHSSARLERYLQLCAEHNVQVCIPSTPAQVFHMIRRQSIRPLRKPLVVMTPKSLLRHPMAVSSLEDICEGQFQPVIGEVDNLDPSKVNRIVLCSGKVYYDLYKARMEAKATNVAIIRLEQLYPFPSSELKKFLEPYNALTDVIWCQEEPMNQGAWYSSQHHIRRVFNEKDSSLYLLYAGRAGSAAPATGFMKVHLQQQKELVQKALFGL